MGVGLHNVAGGAEHFVLSGELGSERSNQFSASFEQPKPFGLPITVGGGVRGEEGGEGRPFGQSKNPTPAEGARSPHDALTPRAPPSPPPPRPPCAAEHSDISDGPQQPKDVIVHGTV